MYFRRESQKEPGYGIFHINPFSAGLFHIFKPFIEENGLISTT